MDCNFIDLEIHVRTANRAQLALSLLFMGAVYSNACRIAVCTHPDRACTACFDRSECFWRRVFGQELSTDPAALKRHQKPPLPFVFSFLQCSIPPDTPGILVCGLVVVGCAISCLGMLLKGFSSLLDGDSCPVQAEVVHLFTRDYQGTPTALVTCDQAGTATNLTVLSSAGLLESHAWNSDHCTLRLLSPLKLRFADRLLRRFDFSLFARSLMRRVSALVYY